MQSIKKWSAILALSGIFFVLGMPFAIQEKDFGCKMAEAYRGMTKEETTDYIMNAMSGTWYNDVDGSEIKVSGRYFNGCYVKNMEITGGRITYATGYIDVVETAGLRRIYMSWLCNDLYEGGAVPVEKAFLDIKGVGRYHR